MFAINSAEQQGDCCLLTKVFLGKSGRNMFCALKYGYILLGRLKMEKENEKQALVAEVLLGADFLLYCREKTCTSSAVKTVLWDTTAICLLAKTKYVTFNCAH